MHSRTEPRSCMYLSLSQSRNGCRVESAKSGEVGFTVTKFRDIWE